MAHGAPPQQPSQQGLRDCLWNKFTAHITARGDGLVDRATIRIAKGMRRLNFRAFHEFPVLEKRSAA